MSIARYVEAAISVSDLGFWEYCSSVSTIPLSRQTFCKSVKPCPVRRTLSRIHWLRSACYAAIRSATVHEI